MDWAKNRIELNRTKPKALPFPKAIENYAAVENLNRTWNSRVLKKMPSHMLTLQGVYKKKKEEESGGKLGKMGENLGKTGHMEIRLK